MHDDESIVLIRIHADKFDQEVALDPTVCDYLICEPYLLFVCHATAQVCQILHHVACAISTTVFLLRYDHVKCLFYFVFYGEVVRRVGFHDQWAIVEELVHLLLAFKSNPDIFTRRFDLHVNLCCGRCLALTTTNLVHFYLFVFIDLVESLPGVGG